MTINDLAKIIQLIDASAERGAIRGDELLIVGQLRQDVKSTLESAQKQTSDDAVKEHVVTSTEPSKQEASSEDKE